MPSTSRTRTLATGANLQIALSGDQSGRFALPQGKTLTAVSITVSEAGAGPIRANAVVSINGNNDTPFVMGSAKWLRGDTTFGFRESWNWDGEFATSLAEEKDALLALVRNDSGASVEVKISWSWRR